MPVGIDGADAARRRSHLRQEGPRHRRARRRHRVPSYPLDPQHRLHQARRRRSAATRIEVQGRRAVDQRHSAAHDRSTTPCSFRDESAPRATATRDLHAGARDERRPLVHDHVHPRYHGAGLPVAPSFRRARCSCWATTATTATTRASGAPSPSTTSRGRRRSSGGRRTRTAPSAGHASATASSSGRHAWPRARARRRGRCARTRRR